MREQGQDINVAKCKVKNLLGIPAVIRIGSARGKSETANGQVTALFPAVFTIKFDDGTSRTFSYADVLTGSVLFFDPNKKTP